LYYILYNIIVIQTVILFAGRFWVPWKF